MYLYVGKGRTLKLTGNLDFETVPHWLKKTKSIFKTPEPILVDLAAVERMDSAGLALLLEWLRVGKSKKTAISFQNIPNQVRAYANICGLGDIFPKIAYRNK